MGVGLQRFNDSETGEGSSVLTKSASKVSGVRWEKLPAVFKSGTPGRTKNASDENVFGARTDDRTGSACSVRVHTWITLHSVLTPPIGEVLTLSSTFKFHLRYIHSLPTLVSEIYLSTHHLVYTTLYTPETSGSRRTILGSPLQFQFSLGERGRVPAGSSLSPAPAEAMKLQSSTPPLNAHCRTQFAPAQHLFAPNERCTRVCRFVPGLLDPCEMGRTSYVGTGLSTRLDGSRHHFPLPRR